VIYIHRGSIGIPTTLSDHQNNIDLRKRTQVKKFMKAVLFMILPVVVTVLLALTAKAVVGAPTEVPAIVDSGERWYNPMSYALDESAEHAKMTADSALRLSVDYTQLMLVVGALVAGVVLTMLIVAIQQGWVIQKNLDVIPSQALTETHTPPQRPPQISAKPSKKRDSRDEALQEEPMATATANAY
jgi:hypothetical protein